MAQPETPKQWEKNVGGSAPVSQQLAPNTYASETALTSPEADVVTKSGSQLQQNESASDSTSPAFLQAATAAPPPEASPNPRSCVTCRRRKVRCNKHHPCSNCIKAKIECVYPSPGRAPRKSKKPRDTELLARLRNLENIVKNLGGPDAINGNPSSLSLKKPTLHQNSAIEQPGNYANTSDAVQQDATIKSEVPDTSEIEENMGKLMVEEGGSQYVSHRFWTTFGKTVRLYLLFPWQPTFYKY